MAVSMMISSQNADAEELQQLTLELMNTMNSETDVGAALPEIKSEAGSRGDAVTLGQIILTALTSGTVVALFEVLRAYFERKPSLEIELQRTDGEKISIRAEQVGRDQLDQTIGLADRFLKGSNG